MRRIRLPLLLIAATAVACGDAVGPETIVGDYSLTSVNDKPIPAIMFPADSTPNGIDFLLTRATLSLRADGTYSAVTCYDFVPGDCTASRHENGRYDVVGDTVALDALDGYTRHLIASGGMLTQRGGGDFRCNDDDQHAAGVVCFILVYSK